LRWEFEAGEINGDVVKFDLPLNLRFKMMGQQFGLIKIIAPIGSTFTVYPSLSGTIMEVARSLHTPNV
jgi:hypothetical protein